MKLFPFAVRARGIGVEKFFGKLGGFFSTNVNPIAMAKIGWKFMGEVYSLVFHTHFKSSQLLEILSPTHIDANSGYSNILRLDGFRILLYLLHVS